MIILAKHAIKPYFYNVIFWNMKYLFFLIVSSCYCVVCDLSVQEDRRKFM
jgi:hypothetical protein